MKNNILCQKPPDFALFTFILKNNLSTTRSPRPDLSGALFARRDPSTSSGQAYKKAGTEGGNWRPNK